MNVHFVCLSCGRHGEAERGIPRQLTSTCFACHAKGVGLRLVGPTGGRESFHDETVASVTEKMFRMKPDNVELERKPTGVSPTSAFL